MTHRNTLSQVSGFHPEFSVLYQAKAYAVRHCKEAKSARTRVLIAAQFRTASNREGPSSAATE